MKRIIYLLVIPFVLLVGCKSEYGKYNGESVVYLSNYGSAKLDTTKVSFTYINKDSTYVPVYIQFKTIGQKTDYDREIKLRINLHNCVEGTDVDRLEETQILEAGQLIKTLVVNVRRSDAIQLEEKKIDIELLESKDFKLLYTEFRDGKDTLTTLRHTILFSEFMNEAPKTWSNSHFGIFSAKKFITICNSLNVSREKFLDVMYMSTGRKNYMKKEMIKILQAAKDAGNTIYEADGVTEMKMGS